MKKKNIIIFFNFYKYKRIKKSLVLRIYFAHAVTNADSFAIDINFLYSFLKKKKIQIIKPDPVLFPELLVKSTLKAISAADLIIADVSIYSHGVGFEIGYAYAKNKLIVVIANKQYKQKISNFIKGLFSEIIYYENINDLCNKLSLKLVESKDKIDINYEIITSSTNDT